MAFGFGWLAHRVPELLTIWSKRWALHLALAVAFTCASLWLAQQAPNPFAVPHTIKLMYAASYTLAIWCWVFAIIGAAVRFCSGYSATRRYLADASYWMYLAHLPVVFALQLLVLKWPTHWSIKFPLVVTGATVVLLVSYHLFVRNTAIGAILNGRRAPQSPSPDARPSQSI